MATTITERPAVRRPTIPPRPPTPAPDGFLALLREAFRARPARPPRAPSTALEARTRPAPGGWTPTRNAAMFRRVADEIEAHPDQYSQSCWERCIAGTAARLAGAELPGEAHQCGDVTRPSVENTVARAKAIDEAGAAALGLTTHEATVLFHATWGPRLAGYRSVPEALRAYADGATISVNMIQRPWL